MKSFEVIPYDDNSNLFWRLINQIHYLWYIAKYIASWFRMVTGSAESVQQEHDDILKWIQDEGFRQNRLYHLWDNGLTLCNVILSHMGFHGSCSHPPSEGISHAHHLATSLLKISPIFDTEDFNSKSNDSLDSKLADFVRELKSILLEKKDEDPWQSDVLAARGIGLYGGYTGFKAVWYVYNLNSEGSLNGVLVEIRGPSETIASLLTGVGTAQYNTIELNYRIQEDRIIGYYNPTLPGNYQVSISKFGIPLPGSPFHLRIEEPPDDYRGMLGANEWDRSTTKKDQSSPPVVHVTESDEPEVANETDFIDYKEIHLLKQNFEHKTLKNVKSLIERFGNTAEREIIGVEKGEASELEGIGQQGETSWKAKGHAWSRQEQGETQLCSSFKERRSPSASQAEVVDLPLTQPLSTVTLQDPWLRTNFSDEIPPLSAPNVDSSDLFLVKSGELATAEPCWANPSLEDNGQPSITESENVWESWPDILSPFINNFKSGSTESLVSKQDVGNPTTNKNTFKHNSNSTELETGSNLLKEPDVLYHSSDKETPSTLSESESNCNEFDAIFLVDELFHSWSSMTEFGPSCKDTQTRLVPKAPLPSRHSKGKQFVPYKTQYLESVKNEKLKSCQPDLANLTGDINSFGQNVINYEGIDKTYLYRDEADDKLEQGNKKSDVLQLILSRDNNNPNNCQLVVSSSLDNNKDVENSCTIRCASINHSIQLNDKCVASDTMTTSKAAPLKKTCFKEPTTKVLIQEYGSSTSSSILTENHIVGKMTHYWNNQIKNNDPGPPSKVSTDQTDIRPGIVAKSKKLFENDFQPSSSTNKNISINNTQSKSNYVKAKEMFNLLEKNSFSESSQRKPLKPFRLNCFKRYSNHPVRKSVRRWKLKRPPFKMMTHITKEAAVAKFNNKAKSCTDQLKQIKIQNLFQNDNGFNKVPNNDGILATLNSLRGHNSTAYDEMWHIANNQNCSSAPDNGFSREYPYLPTTPPYKSRPRSPVQYNLMSFQLLVNNQIKI